MANIRHRTTAVALGVLLFSGFTGTAAYATTTPYPPQTPTPTVSGVKSSTTPATSPKAEVLGSSLPRTGTDVALWVLAGGALVAGGSAMVAGSHHRRLNTHKH